MPNYTKPGSGTRGVDEYREIKAAEATNALTAGNGVLCVSGDHSSAGELCVETIARLKNEKSKTGRNLVDNGRAYDAVNQLRRGYGHHVAQASHAGADTCVQTIVKATT